MTIQTSLKMKADLNFLYKKLFMIHVSHLGNETMPVSTVSELKRSFLNNLPRLHYFLSIAVYSACVRKKGNDHQSLMD